MSAEKSPSQEHRPNPDSSLRNFVVGLLAVSAIVIVVMYIIQSAA